MAFEQISQLEVAFPVHVQISIFSSGSRYTGYISANMNMFHCFPIELTSHDVDELNSELQEAVEQISHQPDNKDDMKKALTRLAQKGQYTFHRIFSEGIPRETIRASIETNAIIQIVSKDFIIPWELLYDGPLGAKVNINCFWGIRCVIARTLIQSTRSGNIISPVIRSTRPHVGLVICNSLEHVMSKEIRYFQKMHQEEKIVLSALRSLNIDQRGEELEFLGHFLQKEELQVIHLACHAYEKKPLSQSYLLISDEFDVTMEDFVVQEFNTKHNPFVILNACLTGTLSPLHTSNWAALFWEHGARGVLATELRIPDWFAAVFTEELYKHFLMGRPIGESLLLARRHFWNEWSSPLGLAYALYSSPAIRIVNTNKI